ncbi:MAG: hypothetical protein ACI9IV_000045 [Paracoccaceae bacterium]|jgi:hypothetical protein
MAFRVEDTVWQTRAGDAALDYCLWPYERPVPPLGGALRSEAMLAHSFEFAGIFTPMMQICAALRRALGPFKTVWGIKSRNGVLSWELYFYDYARLERTFGMAGFRKATEGLLNVTAPVADDRPYFMFSVEIEKRHLMGDPIDQVDIYIGNPGSDVSSGICYGVSRAGIEMRNFYFFFDAVPHAAEIADKIASNAHIPVSRLHLPDILWPRMASAQTIVVANKRHNDGLYFSRIGVDPLIYFLQRLDFPAPLTEFARTHRDRFAHHLFDVGYDYLPDLQGGIRTLKGSYYGLF